jgi:hypothetical protein
MTGLFTRALRPRRRRARAPRDPDAVIRAFVRTLEALRLQARAVQTERRP